MQIKRKVRVYTVHGKDTTSLYVVTSDINYKGSESFGRLGGWWLNQGNIWKKLTLH